MESEEKQYQALWRWSAVGGVIFLILSFALSKRVHNADGAVIVLVLLLAFALYEREERVAVIVISCLIIYKCLFR